jgi:hypothetical protein
MKQESKAKCAANPHQSHPPEAETLMKQNP